MPVKIDFFLTGLVTIINAFPYSGISFSIPGIFICRQMMVSQILKSEFTNFFNVFLFWFLFQLLKLTTIRGQNRGNKLVWKDLMNSWRQKKCRANEKMQGEEKNWQDNRNRKWLLKHWQNENIACNKKCFQKNLFSLHPAPCGLTISLNRNSTHFL